MESKQLLAYLKIKVREEIGLAPSYSDILTQVVDSVTALDEDNGIAWNKIPTLPIPKTYEAHRLCEVDISYATTFLLDASTLKTISEYQTKFASVFGVKRFHRGAVIKFFLKAYVISQTVHQQNLYQE